jgi:hypothetical protein
MMRLRAEACSCAAHACRWCAAHACRLQSSVVITAAVLLWDEQLVMSSCL